MISALNTSSPSLQKKHGNHAIHIVNAVHTSAILMEYIALIWGKFGMYVGLVGKCG